LQIHQQHSVRNAFSTWSFHAKVKEQFDRLKRGRLKLQVSHDQLAIKKNRIVTMEREWINKSNKFDVFFAFHKFLQLKQINDYNKNVSILEREREHMIQELQIIDDRMNKLNMSSNEAEHVKRQRGGLVIHSLNNFSDTLAHEVVKMRNM